MKNFSFKDVFYGIVLIACVVLYSYLTRYEVVVIRAAPEAPYTYNYFKYDRMFDKFYTNNRNNRTWVEIYKPDN